MKSVMRSVFAVLLCAAPVRALTIQVSPETPRVGETVTVTASGSFPDMCWYVTGFDCGELDGGVIDITVNSYDRYWGVCLAVITPYEVVCTYEFEAAGTYTLRAHDIGESLTRPFERVSGCEIVVVDHVGVEKTSWSAFKASYR